MALIAREAVRITPETTYGVYDSGGAATAAILHLPDGNSQTMRGKALRWSERSAAGSNRLTYQGSKQFEVSGTLTTRLFPSQAGVLCPLFANIAGTPMLDLPSFTLDHKIVFDDGGGVSYTRYKGCKIGKADVTANNTVGGTVARMTLALVGQSVDRTITATDFPEPSFATTPHYPIDNPYVFQETSGKVLMTPAGVGTPVVVTGYREISLSVNNMLRTPRDEGRFIRKAHWSGRDVSLSITRAYNSDDDRQAYEDVTASAVSFAFDDGVKTLTFDLLGRCYFTAVDDDLPFVGDGYYQKLSLESYLDTSLSTPNDLTVTLTTNP